MNTVTLYLIDYRLIFVLAHTRLYYNLDTNDMDWVLFEWFISKTETSVG